MRSKLSSIVCLFMILQLLVPIYSVFAADVLAPTNVTASQYYPGNITLKWDKMTGAMSYRVYKIIGDQRELAAEVSYKYTEATVYGVPEGSSTFAVTSVRNSYESELSNTVTVEVVYPEMQAPVNLRSSVANGNDLTLSWDSAKYATSYKIYKIDNGVKTSIATTKNISYTWTNHPEGNFIYEVTSFNDRFGESEQGVQLEVNVVFPVMQAPATTYTIQNGNDIAFSWQKVNYATNYRVYRVVDGQRTLLTTTKSLSYTVTNAPIGKQAYEITAYSDRFGESSLPALIELELTYPQMQAPKSFTYEFSNVNDLTLRWSPVDYASAYHLYQVVNGERKLVSSSLALNAFYPNMAEGHYVYELNSYSDRFGESAKASRIEFDVIHPDLQPPNNLRVTVENGNDLILRWDAAQYATAYKVYQIVNGEKKLVATRQQTLQGFLNMPEGNYVFEVSSYSDRFGESSTTSRVEYQLGYPTLTAPTLTGKVVNTNTIVLDWTKTDNVTAYKLYQVMQDTKKVVVTTTNLHHELANKPAGEYVFEVTTYNDSFGESPASNQVALYIEPTLEAPVTSEPKVEEDSVTLSWNSVPQAESYNVYEVVNGELKLVENTTSTTVTIGDLQPGDHEYRIVAVSSTGKEAETYSSINVRIDQSDVTPPVTTSNVIEDCTNQDVVVQLTASDDQSGVAKTFYAINGAEFVEGTTFTISEQGEYEVSFYSVDKAGNTESASTVKVHVDKTAPVTTSNATEGWLNQNSNIELSATDHICGVDKTYHSIDGSEFKEGTIVVADEGVHNISFYSVDKAGNKEEAKTVEVKVDKTAPVTTSDARTDWSKDVTVQLAATDNLSGIEKTYYSINGSELAEGTKFTVNEEGITKVIFYSVDVAGNKEEVQSVVVKVDKTAPVTTSNITASWSKDDFAVELTASDSASGVHKTFYSVNGSQYVEGTRFTVSEEGVNKVSYYSLDNAGNVEDAKTIEVKVDKTAPVVSWNLADEYAIGTKLPSYSADDAVSGIASEIVTLNGREITGPVILDKPGTYNLVLTVKDYAGWTTTVEKNYVVYVPSTLEVLPKVIKGNKGVFTVKVNLPNGYDAALFDLSSVRLNGVAPILDKNGHVNQSEKGQFKFNREDFNWNKNEVIVEFRGMLDGKLVVGSTTVKVLTK